MEKICSRLNINVTRFPFFTWSFLFTLGLYENVIKMLHQWHISPVRLAIHKSFSPFLVSIDIVENTGGLLSHEQELIGIW